MEPRYITPNGRIDAFSLAWLLGQDHVFFSPNEIAWDGEHHIIQGAQINSTSIEEVPSFVAGKDEYFVGMVDFLSKIEANRALMVPREAIHPALYSAIREGDLTGITLFNLMACGRAFSFLAEDSSTKNSMLELAGIPEAFSDSQLADDIYYVAVDARLTRGIPGFYALIKQLIIAMRDYDDFGGSFAAVFVNCRNFDADRYLDNFEGTVEGAFSEAVHIEKGCDERLLQDGGDSDRLGTAKRGLPNRDAFLDSVSPADVEQLLDVEPSARVSDWDTDEWSWDDEREQSSDGRSLSTWDEMRKTEETLSGGLLPTEEGIEVDSVDTLRTTDVISDLNVPEIAENTARNGFDVKIGDIVELGSYPTDVNGGKQPIKWRIIEIRGSHALALSESLIDFRKYDENDGSTTWETSTIRSWLNNDFVTIALTSEDKKRIAGIKLVNLDNGEYGTRGGASTKDRIFLLSIEEVERLLPSPEDRKAEPTPFAEGIGANQWWWLRSPGFKNTHVAYVGNDGAINHAGTKGNLVARSVRPAFYLKLKA